ncbi:type IV pili methyl-accepting chemotaxis transducer N-terminal domain-containing protein [Rhodoferax sp. PAMC 29310]|uniref:type IV pili methyl-accepting chemotaxis transducer N-terminal domain-containing protein n=1 Tax=Rhodoferax sp. PAMC 29310 TaxID=2822760 RepID=UPI001B326EEE|nr:type IV pili methyl-accepting chemotaxis transducer N-terminal domain-containing protein [Rhodoferax sp. PAMC 29310]
MTSALVHLNGSPGSTLAFDLESAGIHVICVTVERQNFVRDVVQHAPDLVVVEDALPDDSLFKATQSIAEISPRPVVVFTNDSDAEHIVRAVQSGIHAYVVNSYAPQRLRYLAQMALARFRHEQALRNELRDVTSRFEERKMVDRAKGILMRARQVSDDDAFQILRTASMHSHQRLGQVSQQIIQSARFAESVNRAGQLRMLSQQIIKLVLLQLAGIDAPAQQQRLKEATLRIDGTLVHLGKTLSKPTYGDLRAQVLLTWARLKAALQATPRADQMTYVDELAELLLQEAERLTTSLENAGSVSPLQVLNVAGRQRMLSQRYAKYALLQVLGGADVKLRCESGMAAARTSFEQSLQYLDSIPLSTPEIRNALEASGKGWLQLLAGAAEANQPGGQDRVALASEELLELFEQLSGHYERSMQMLGG